MVGKSLEGSVEAGSVRVVAHVHSSSGGRIVARVSSSKGLEAVPRSSSATSPQKVAVEEVCGLLTIIIITFKIANSGPTVTHEPKNFARECE